MDVLSSILKNNFFNYIFKPIFIFIIYIISPFIKLDKRLKEYFIYITETRHVFALFQIVIFMLKYKCSKFEKINPGFTPIFPEMFYERKVYVFLGAIYGFIDYIEKSKPKTFFQKSSLLQFYIVLFTFSKNKKYSKKAFDRSSL